MLIYHLSVLDLATNVQFVKGIGPKIAQILLEKGISTVEDLLYYLPFRYEDRLNPRGIGELRAGEMASIIAEVRTFGLFRTRRMPIFEMTVGQGRDTLKCMWFNATYLQDKFRAGMWCFRCTARSRPAIVEATASKLSSRSLKFCTIQLPLTARQWLTNPNGNHSRLVASFRFTKLPATAASPRAGFGG